MDQKRHTPSPEDAVRLAPSDRPRRQHEEDSSIDIQTLVVVVLVIALVVIFISAR